MKKEYTSPCTELIDRQFSESLLNAASPTDQYSIGGDNSQWPEEGPIDDDWGQGPGVSGAKGGHFSTDWDVAEPIWR